MKKPIWKRWYVWTIVVLLIVIVAASGNGEEEIVTPPVQAEETEPEPVKEPEPMVETGVSDEKQEYLDFMASNSSTMSKSLIKLSELCANPEYTDEWTINVAGEIVIIRMCCEEAIDENPPEIYKKAHDYYIQGCKQYLKSVDYLIEGLDNFDADLIEKAGEYMNKGTEYINKATDNM